MIRDSTSGDFGALVRAYLERNGVTAIWLADELGVSVRAVRFRLSTRGRLSSAVFPTRVPNTEIPAGVADARQPPPEDPSPPVASRMLRSVGWRAPAHPGRRGGAESRIDDPPRQLLGQVRVVVCTDKK